MSFILNYRGIELLIMLFIRLAIIFLILPVHEFAHGYSARKLGDNTALIAGRLTLNPLAHVDPIGAALLLLTGFGWAKPVPVNPRNFKNYRRDFAITAAAGPASNFICALIAIFVYRVLLNVSDLMSPGPVLSYIIIAVLFFARVNLSLAVFNLIPVEPLDGSRIFSYLLPPKANAFITKYRSQIMIVFMVLILFGALSWPLSWLMDKIFKLFYHLFFWVDLIFKVI